MTTMPAGTAEALSLGHNEVVPREWMPMLAVGLASVVVVPVGDHVVGVLRSSAPPEVVKGVVVEVVVAMEDEGALGAWSHEGFEDQSVNAPVKLFAVAVKSDIPVVAWTRLSSGGEWVPCALYGAIVGHGIEALKA